MIFFTFIITKMIYYYYIVLANVFIPEEYSNYTAGYHQSQELDGTLVYDKHYMQCISVLMMN